MVAENEYDWRKDDKLRVEDKQKMSELEEKLDELRRMALEPVFGDGELEGYQDDLKTKTGIYFGWIDRIKILFGYTVTINSYVLFENSIGGHKVEVRVDVYKINRRYRGKTHMSTSLDVDPKGLTFEAPK